jgi:predicted nucleotidyltransferase
MLRDNDNGNADRRTMTLRDGDASLAHEIARRIVAAGGGRVRLVALIGSRAKGMATEQSDLDVVVLEETASSDRPWTGEMIDGERDRLLRAVGQVAVPVDLTVRTTDEYYEARTIFGGVEQLIDREGIVLYTRPYDRAPTIRRDRDTVLLALSLTWLDGACRSIDEATKRIARERSASRTPQLRMAGEGGGMTVRFGAPSAGWPVPALGYEHRARQQAVASLCTLYQVESSKADDIATIIARLRAQAPGIPPTLQSLVTEPPTLAVAVATALTALDVVASELEGDSPMDAMRHFLSSVALP